MIEDTSFGEVVIDGQTYEHDVVIFPGKIIQRKKWITKDQHGTSHKFTKEEMKEYIDQVDKQKIKRVVMGTGQYGELHLLQETQEYLRDQGIEFIERKTPALVDKSGDHRRNHALFIIHVTC